MLLQPKKIFLLGFMGSGKSYWGKLWAEEMNLPFIEIDELVEKAEGRAIAEIFEQKGETYFRQLESKLLKELMGEQDCIISTGGGVPCFFDNMKWMNEQGATVYLKASPKELALRLQDEKEKRPLIKNVSAELLEDFIAAKLSERESFYNQAKFILNVASLNKGSLKDIGAENNSTT